MSSPAAQTTVWRYLLLAVGIAGLSSAGIFYSLAHAPVVTVVAYRTLFGVLFIVPVALIARRVGAPQTRAPISRAELWMMLAAGFLFSLDLTIWALSLRFTTVASAALFVSTDPIWVALLAWLFLRERLTPAMLAGIAIAIIGIAIVAGQDVRLSGRALLGDGIALLAALAESGYLLCGRHVRQRIDAPRYALIVYVTCAVFVTAYALVSGAGLAISHHDLALAIGVALCATAIGHTLVSWSLGHMPAVVVGVSFLAQPLMAAVFALIFLGQHIPVATALGGAVALAGIGVVAYASERLLV